MAFLLHERITATAIVKDNSYLNIPNNATHALLQADSGDVRYTADGSTDPTQTTGMVLWDGLEPESFLIEDIYKLRFTRGQGSDCGLNVHFFAGRDV